MHLSLTSRFSFSFLSSPFACYASDNSHALNRWCSNYMILEVCKTSYIVYHLPDWSVPAMLAMENLTSQPQNNTLPRRASARLLFFHCTPQLKSWTFRIHMSVQISAIQLVTTKSRLLSMKDRRYDCIILAKEPVSVSWDHDALVPIQLCASTLTYRRPEACRLLTSSELQENRMPCISLHIIILSSHAYSLKPLRLLITISCSCCSIAYLCESPSNRPQCWHGQTTTSWPLPWTIKYSSPQPWNSTSSLTALSSRKNIPYQALCVLFLFPSPAMANWQECLTSKVPSSDSGTVTCHSQSNEADLLQHQSYEKNGMICLMRNGSSSWKDSDDFKLLILAIRSRTIRSLVRLTLTRTDVQAHICRHSRNSIHYMAK